MKTSSRPKPQKPKAKVAAPPLEHMCKNAEEFALKTNEFFEQKNPKGAYDFINTQNTHSSFLLNHFVLCFIQGLSEKRHDPHKKIAFLMEILPKGFFDEARPSWAIVKNILRKDYAKSLDVLWTHAPRLFEVSSERNHPLLTVLGDKSSKCVMYLASSSVHPHLNLTDRLKKAAVFLALAQSLDTKTLPQSSKDVLALVSVKQCCHWLLEEGRIISNMSTNPIHTPSPYSCLEVFMEQSSPSIQKEILEYLTPLPQLPTVLQYCPLIRSLHIKNQLKEELPSNCGRFVPKKM